MDRQPPWYRTWLSRSVVIIGVGLVLFVCSLWITPTDKLGSGLAGRLDDQERIALLGLIAVLLGIGMSLICAMVWLKIGLSAAFRKLVRVGNRTEMRDHEERCAEQGTTLH